MTDIFTNVIEPRRGKGGRKAHLGPHIRMESKAKSGREKDISTPNKIAIKKLSGFLLQGSLKGKDVTGYTDLLKTATQIRFMNMRVLAEVILYMDKHGFDTETFNYDSILDYINKLIPQKEVIQKGIGTVENPEGRIKTKEISEDVLKAMRLRMAATFFRYIQYIKLLQKQAAQELEEAQARQTEMRAPSIDEL
jgi:CRISPR/Cas system CMR-associated protein Cmr5 small subunit